MEWQPIETAPRDGTHIIAKFDEGAIEAWYYDYTDEHSGIRRRGWNVAVLDSHGCGCCGLDNDPPTHWMPLPEQPQIG